MSIRVGSYTVQGLIFYSSFYFIFFQSRSSDLVFEDVDEDFDQDLGQLSLGTSALSFSCGCCKPLVLQYQSFYQERQRRSFYDIACHHKLEANYNVVNTSYVTLFRDISQLREDMNFMSGWQEQYLTIECSKQVRYCSCHENTKIISLS